MIRLPPYHPEPNAIELIWAEVKNWVAANYVTFKIQDVKQLAQRKFDNISVEDWKKGVKTSRNTNKNLLRTKVTLKILLNLLSST